MGIKFLTENETAIFFGLTLKGLQAQRYRGEGPAYHKIGKKVLYNEEDILAYVKQTRIDPAQLKAGGRKHI